MTDQPSSIFVYGTLKRGQFRERCWPRRPLRIEAASVRGTLYDLGPYPALTDGDDVVSGEVWQVAPEDISVTLAELDRVEGCAGRADDLYHRVTITCQTAAGSVSAWVYRYARAQELKPNQRIAPTPATCQCCWPAFASITNP